MSTINTGLTKVTIPTPDDWHIHLRDGNALLRTVKDAAKQFRRAIIMPNLPTPITDWLQAKAYWERIVAALETINTEEAKSNPDHSSLQFDPLMTLYLTDGTTRRTILEAKQSGIIYGCKLYPQGCTTNSQNGVTDLSALYPVFEAMSEVGIPLLIHGEVTSQETDVFDKEKAFIDTVLSQLIKRFPQLKIVLEHITTMDAVEFVKSTPKNVGATITAHHLLFNRNAIFNGGIRPHYYCLPILKRKEHQQALIQAATSNNPKFFLGTDSAPHAINKKEAACGCAGIYTAFTAMELYATVFDNAGKLDLLSNFASKFGAEFYNLPIHRTTITLEKTAWVVPETLPFGETALHPLLGGQTINWKRV